MRQHISKLKYGLPVIPLGLAIISLAVSGQSAPGNAESARLTNSSQADATRPHLPTIQINGQAVRVPTNGSATVEVKGTRATVSVNGHGTSAGGESGNQSSSQVTQSGSSVNVTVVTRQTTSAGSSSAGGTSARVQGTSQTSSRDTSTLRVRTSGTGNVNVTK